jgi:hypothetical protein
VYEPLMISRGKVDGPYGIAYSGLMWRWTHAQTKPYRCIDLCCGG